MAIQTMPPSTAAANNAARMLGTSIRRSLGLRRLRHMKMPFERKTYGVPRHADTRATFTATDVQAAKQSPVDWGIVVGLFAVALIWRSGASTPPLGASDACGRKSPIAVVR